MSVEKFWMVVDVSCVLNGYYGEALPGHKAPRFIHETEKSADTECLRLAREHPDGEFVVLEAMSFAKPIDNNWANITSRSPVKTIRLVDCIDESEAIPF